MSDELYFMACLTSEHRAEIELLEMKACMALLDDQIIQLRRFRELHSNPGLKNRIDDKAAEYDGLMASVAQSTSMARQLNARATETLSQRVGLGAAHAN